MPKPKPRSSSPPRASRTDIPAASARRRSWSSNAVLPIPAGPSISSTRPAPTTASWSASCECGQVVLAVQKAVGGLVARSKDCGRLFGRQLCREPPFRWIIIS